MHNTKSRKHNEIFVGYVKNEIFIDTKEINLFINIFLFKLGKDVNS